MSRQELSKLRRCSVDRADQLVSRPGNGRTHIAVSLCSTSGSSFLSNRKAILRRQAQFTRRPLFSRYDDPESIPIPIEHFPALYPAEIGSNRESGAHHPARCCVFQNAASSTAFTNPVIFPVMSLARLLICVVGVYATFLLWAIAQERREFCPARQHLVLIPCHP